MKGFIKRTLDKRKIKREDRRAFKSLLISLKAQTNEFYKEYLLLFANKSRYLPLDEILVFQDKYTHLHDKISINLANEEHVRLIKRYKRDLSLVLYVFEAIYKARNKHNRPIIRKQIAREDKALYLGDLELTREQKYALVKDDKKIILQGPSSSGLSTTCIAKAHYLEKHKGYKQEEILFITDSKKNTDKANEIFKGIGSSIRARDFVSLSKEILAFYGKKIPRLKYIDYEDFSQEALRSLLEKDDYKERFVNYYINFRQAGQVVFDFNNYEDYQAYLEAFPPISLDGKKMKNYEHLAIADFLFRNSIEYLYKPEYPIASRESDGRIYSPDFYLPDYDIYIDVFEINTSGDAIFKKETLLTSKSPTEIYREKMTRIREIHASNHTDLLECFTYEKMENILFDKLKRKLMERGLVFLPLDSDELIDIIFEKNPFILRELTILLSEILSLVRDSSFSFEEIVFLNREISRTKEKNYRRNESILSLLVPLYERYLELLADGTDSFGLIHEAAEAIRLSKNKLGYRYIILDNWHNSNRQRNNLFINIWDNIKEEASLLVAGDDWQTKSGLLAFDISYFTEISRFVGHPEYVKLTRVFGRQQEIWLKNARFIEKNTSQTRKYARCSLPSMERPFEAIEYEYEKTDKTKVYSQKEKTLIYEALSNYINELDKDKTLALVSRYREDYDMAKDFVFNRLVSLVDIYDLDGSYDIVILLNCKRNYLAFPDPMHKERIGDLFGLKPEYYPFASQRRLWHQSVSRARERVVFLYNKNNKSSFLSDYI